MGRGGRLPGRAAPVSAPQWLEPQFLFPDWTTHSTFKVVTPITQTGLNADNLPIAQSVITNSDLEITLRHEMLDTVVGTPMGTTPASSAGAGASINSSRYVLKQTAHDQEHLRRGHLRRAVLPVPPRAARRSAAFTTTALYAGPLSEFRYDVTLAGVDPWAVGAGSSSAGLEDFIGFHAERRAQRVRDRPLRHRGQRH